MTTYDNPSGVAAPPPGRYSHVASIDVADRKFLIISGQTAMDADGELIGPDDMTAQATAVFDQIATILAAHGATLSDVVNIRVFLADKNRFPEFSAARLKCFARQDMPTSTAVEVSHLLIPGALLEVEAMAVV